jgi:hypothetical protein
MANDSAGIMGGYQKSYSFLGGHFVYSHLVSDMAGKRAGDDIDFF